MTPDHLVGLVAVTVSLATAAGRLRRYSEAKPLGMSLTRLVQPAPRVYTWAALISGPKSVTTSSSACVVAAAVDKVTEAWLALTARVPVRSSGAAATTFRHSVIWAMLPFGTTNLALTIPPGLFR